MPPAFVQAPALPTADAPLRIAVHADDVAHSATVVVTGEMDLAFADNLAEILRDQHRRTRRYVRLDVSELTFLDTTALGVLLDAHYEFLARRGTLTLTGVGRPVSRLLAITGLDGVLLVAGPRSPFAGTERQDTAAGLRPVAV